MNSTAQFTLEHLPHRGMNRRNGTITHQASHIILDYVKPYLMPIVLECLLSVKIFPLDDHRVAVPDLPYNHPCRSVFNVVHQSILVPILIFIHPGYKSIIIAPIPINGLVIPKLNSSMFPEMLPSQHPRIIIV